MGLFVDAESPDCWKLVGEEDGSTPPTVARALNTAGSRAEWRRAGLPVLFDDAGSPRPVLRAGRTYRFECIDPTTASALPHPPPLR